MRMKWERVARGARTAILTIVGFGCLSLAAFLWSPIAGFAAVGVSALLLEYLTQPEQDERSRRA